VSSGRRLAIVLVLFAVGLGISFALEAVTRRRPGPPEEHEPSASASLPQRIVATAPNIVECLFALGVGDRVVGVGDFCTWPPEARDKPRVGGEFNPNFERILALEPDLIVVQGKAEKVDDFSRRYGIRVLRVDMDDLATIYAGLRELGGAVGCRAEAERLVARIRLDLAKVAHRVAGRRRPRVFLCLGRRAGSLRSLFSVGGTSFLSQVLEVAGGENVLADLEQPYPQVLNESLVQRAPEVILELHAGEELSDDVRRRLLGDWEAVASLPAVRSHRIHILTDDYLMIPGPRLAQVAARLAEALHPDLSEPQPSPQTESRNLKEPPNHRTQTAEGYVRSPAFRRSSGYDLGREPGHVPPEGGTPN